MPYARLPAASNFPRRACASPSLHYIAISVSTCVRSIPSLTPRSTQATSHRARRRQGGGGRLPCRSAQPTGPSGLLCTCSRPRFAGRHAQSATPRQACPDRGVLLFPLTFIRRSHDLTKEQQQCCRPDGLHVQARGHSFPLPRAVLLHVCCSVNNSECASRRIAQAEPNWAPQHSQQTSCRPIFAAPGIATNLIVQHVLDVK